MKRTDENMELPPDIAAKYLGKEISEIKALVEANRLFSLDNGNFVFAQLCHYYTSEYYWKNTPHYIEKRESEGKDAPELMLGHVYFLNAPELNRIKIGFTAQQVPRRNRSTKSESPTEISLIGYTPGTEPYEECLKNKFKSIRVRGEWFKATKELTSEIRKILSEKYSFQMYKITA